MQTLPSRSKPNQAVQITGIACPDCPGVLGLIRNRDHLKFRCRIGHTYSLQDLVISKERRLEEALWAPVTALEELGSLLREVLETGQRISSTRKILEQRATRALRHAEAIRRIIGENDPTLFQEEGTETDS
jgi:two-component system chemotaxis response regulator CheB